MFNPEEFGKAMGEATAKAIAEAVAPLKDEIKRLEKDLEDMAAQLQSEVQAFHGAEPVVGKDGKDGKDCDMDAVKAMIEEAVKAIPVPKDGKDGRDGIDGKDGKDGKDGEKGADGIGAAGAMIDRDGCLVLTMTNGEVKNLGPVVGKDGSDGKDGKDGLSLESFTMEYQSETHEVVFKAVCAGRTQEVRFGAGGIRPGGYWREGVKCLPGELWVHDGSSWIAKNATTSKPESKSEDWIIAARKGRDGETVIKHVKDGPPDPIKLKE